MFILKACPKCSGDLAAESSMRRLTDDSDMACIQCGYTLPPDEQRNLFARLVARAPSARPARVPAYARR